MSIQNSDPHLSARDPQLVLNIVNHLKSQGMFDQFRRECLADVDTKPSFQNLRQRVEGYVSKFLSQQTWKPDLNKNQLRDNLRKQINDSGMLSIGVEHVVDQVVNPKISRTFLPQVESVVRQYLGLERPPEPLPTNVEKKEESKTLEDVPPSIPHLDKIPAKVEEASEKTPTGSTAVEPLEEEPMKEECRQLALEENPAKILKEEKSLEVSVSTNLMPINVSKKVPAEEPSINISEELLPETDQISDAKNCTENITISLDSQVLEEGNFHGFGVAQSTNIDTQADGISITEQPINASGYFDIHVMVQDDNSASCVDSNDGESKLVINEDSMMSEGKFELEEIGSPQVPEENNSKLGVKRENSNSGSGCPTSNASKVGEGVVDFQNIKESVCEFDSSAKDNVKPFEGKTKSEGGSKVSTEKASSSKHFSYSKHAKPTKEIPKKYDKDKSPFKPKSSKSGDSSKPSTSKSNTKHKTSSKDTEKLHKLDSSNKTVKAESSKSQLEHKSRSDSSKPDQKHKSSHSSKSSKASVPIKTSSKSSLGVKGDKNDAEKKGKPSQVDTAEQRQKSSNSDPKTQKDSSKDERKTSKLTSDKSKTHSKHNESKSSATDKQKSIDRSRTSDKPKSKDGPKIIDRSKSSDKSKSSDSAGSTELKRKLEGASSKEASKSIDKKASQSLSKKSDDPTRQTLNSKTSANNSSSNSKTSTNDNSSCNSKESSTNDNSSSCESDTKRFCKSKGDNAMDLGNPNSQDRFRQTCEMEELSNTCFMPENMKPTPIVSESAEATKSNVNNLPPKKVDEVPGCEVKADRLNSESNLDRVDSAMVVSDSDNSGCATAKKEENCKFSDQHQSDLLVVKPETDGDGNVEQYRSDQSCEGDVKSAKISDQMSLKLDKEECSLHSVEGIKPETAEEKSKIEEDVNLVDDNTNSEENKETEVIDLEPQEGKADLMKTLVVQKADRNYELEEAKKQSKGGRESDNEQEDDKKSELSVSSVHTSDLSSFDDKISLSSSDELEAVEAVKPVVKRKKIPLKDIKEVAETYLKERTNSSGRSTPVFPSGDDDTNQSASKRLKKSNLESEGTQSKQDAENQQSDDDDTARGSSRFGRPRKANPKYPSEDYVFNSSWKESEPSPAVVIPSRRTTRRSVEESTRTGSRCSATSDTTDSTPFSKVGERQRRGSKSSEKSDRGKSDLGDSKSADKPTPIKEDPEHETKDEEAAPKPKRRSGNNTSASPEGSKTRTENQRYSSSDLYKPRPLIGSRRHRTNEEATNPEQEPQQSEEQAKRPRGRPRKRPPTPEPSPPVAKRKR